MKHTDQMMREVRLKQPPLRIISLVPSITELLFDLGLRERIAGITKFCIHPRSLFQEKPRIGGTKKIDHFKIEQLQPDLIIANKEENLRTDIELLEKKYPVWVSDIKTLNDALNMIRMIGEITGKNEEASVITSQISNQFLLIHPIRSYRCLYMIWKSPWMAAGRDTFINDMLTRCGFMNVLGEKSRYPVLNDIQIRELNPEIILLSSEPFPFKEEHKEELQQLIPGCTVELADGEYFSWYGSHLKGSPAYFNSLIKKLNNHNPAPTLHEN